VAQLVRGDVAAEGAQRGAVDHPRERAHAQRFAAAAREEGGACALRTGGAIRLELGHTALGHGDYALLVALAGDERAARFEVEVYVA
jgi:hypothetical protein